MEFADIPSLKLWHIIDNISMAIEYDHMVAKYHSPPAAAMWM